MMMTTADRPHCLEQMRLRSFLTFPRIILFYAVWLLLAMSVLVFDQFYYIDVDFAMQTDAPHWSDHPILGAIWVMIMLPLYIIPVVVIAADMLLSIF
jgi:hypothetical protein